MSFSGVQKSIKFEISAGDTLVAPGSRKPKHLQKRKQGSGQAHALGHAFGHGPSSHENAAQRHSLFLAARRAKLQKRLQSVSAVLNSREERQNEVAQQMHLVLCEKLSSAAKKKSERLAATKSLNSLHVQRAKGIARSAQQKLAEDRVLLLRDIERKRRKSTSIRLGLCAVPRSRLLDPASRASHQRLAVQDAAASTIQNWFRHIKFTPIAKIYKKIGLSRTKAAALSFDQLTVRISAPSLIKATGFLIIRANRICGPDATRNLNFKNPARVLNSAFMFSTFPRETLMAHDGQEEDLLVLSEKLVADLDFWVSSSTPAVIAPLAANFIATLISYNTAFEAWKSKDTFKIVDELVGLFMELDAVWVKVALDEGAFEEWATPIQEQQAAHLARIRKFGKDALDRLVMAREEYMTGVFANDELGLERAKDVDITCTASEMYLVKVHQDSVMAAAEVSEATQSSSVHDMPSLGEMNTFGSMFSNEMLAHEMILDPSFSLKAPEKSGLEKSVAEMAKKGFADKVRQELDAGEYDKIVLSLLMDIRAALVGMVDEKGAVAGEISEVFDHDFILHQIKNGVFDLHKIIGYAGEKMLQLCAPVRDAAIKALASEGDVAVLMVRMLDILEEMKLDLANFRLQSINPQLKRQAVDYERTRFNKALQAGNASLVKTDAWLLASYTALQNIANERNPENIDHPDLKVKFGNVFNHALLGLLFSTTPIDASKVAETFYMDQKRLFDMQNELQACTIVAALTMLSKNIIPELRAETGVMKELSDSLFKLLRAEGTGINTLSQEIISAANIFFHKQTKIIATLSLQTSTPTAQVLKTVSDEQESLVQSMVEKTLSHKDAFFSVLARRLERLVKGALEKEDKLDAHALRKNGLELVRDEFVPLVKRITLLAQHNRDVFGEHYDAILKKYVS